MKKIILILGFIALSGNSAFAQVIHESKLRFIRYQALLLVDEYARNCGLRDNYEVDYFNSVFGEGATMNNDVLPDNKLNDQITIEEYGNLLYKYHFDPIYVEVRAYRAIVEEGELQDGGRDVGIVYVDAFKIIESTSKNGYAYNDTLNVRFTISYDITDTAFAITKVETNQRYGKYVVIGIANKKNGKKKVYNSDLQKVLLNTDTITLSSRGEVFRKNVDGNQVIEIEPLSDEYFQSKRVEVEYDEIGADDEARSNYIPVYFRKKRFYIRPSISLFTDNNGFALDGDKNYSTEKSSFGASFGLDFGINLFSFNKRGVPLTASLLVGGKYTMIGYSITAPRFQQIYQAIDADGDPYTRKAIIGDIREEGDISLLQMPLTLRVDYTFNELWGVFIGIGYSYALQRNLNYIITAAGNYQGIYGPEYFNIILNENGVYNFGHFDLENQKDMTETNQMGFLKFDLGASHRINKRLYGEFGFGYWHGLNPMFTGTEHLSGDFSELNTTYQKAVDNGLRVLNFEVGLKCYL